MAEFLTTNGVRCEDVVEGTGVDARMGSLVTITFHAWTYLGDVQGKMFASSDPRPLRFALGNILFLIGLSEGLVGMKVGGERVLFIPPALAYGERGAGGGLIPPNATIKYVVKLLEVEL